MNTLHSTMSNIKNLFLHKKYRFYKNDKGLTIIESLVAISIVVISILGPLVIVSQALKISFFARDQIGAFYLAHEALEHIRNVRDKNSLTSTNPADWLNNIVTSSLQSYPIMSTDDQNTIIKYSLNRNNGGYEISQCPNNICSPIKRNSSTGIYGEINDALPNSVYTREIVFYKALNDDDVKREVVIEVRIFWKHANGVYEFKIRESFANWIIQSYES